MLEQGMPWWAMVNWTYSWVCLETRDTGVGKAKRKESSNARIWTKVILKGWSKVFTFDIFLMTLTYVDTLTLNFFFSFQMNQFLKISLHTTFFQKSFQDSVWLSLFSAAAAQLSLKIHFASVETASVFETFIMGPIHVRLSPVCPPIPPTESTMGRSLLCSWGRKIPCQDLNLSLAGPLRVTQVPPPLCIPMSLSIIGHKPSFRTTCLSS